MVYIIIEYRRILLAHLGEMKRNYFLKNDIDSNITMSMSPNCQLKVSVLICDLGRGRSAHSTTAEHRPQDRGSQRLHDNGANIG